MSVNVVCLYVLALQQTADLSRVYLASSPSLNREENVRGKITERGGREKGERIKANVTEIE